MFNHRCSFHSPDHPSRGIINVGVMAWAGSTTMQLRWCYREGTRSEAMLENHRIRTMMLVDLSIFYRNSATCMQHKHIDAQNVGPDRIAFFFLYKTIIDHSGQHAKSLPLRLKN